MKNNLESRFEHLKQQSAPEMPPVFQEQAVASQSISFVVPTEFVEIPSKGKYYPEGHPLKDQTSVEIKQMTTKEEDILTNKSFIKKGIVIDRLIESILVDKRIPVQSLLVGDKNAMMVAARISAYGPHYDVSLTCTECGNKSINSVDLTEVKVEDADYIESALQDNEMFRHARTVSGNIVVRLPKTNWLVECKLLNGQDEQKIINLIESKKKLDPNADMSFSEQLSIIIDSINGVFDKQALFDAINVMPAGDAKHLRKLYQKLIPNIRIQKKYVCTACEQEQEVELPFTQEFFWPK